MRLYGCLLLLFFMSPANAASQTTSLPVDQLPISPVYEVPPFTIAEYIHCAELRDYLERLRRASASDSETGDDIDGSYIRTLLRARGQHDWDIDYEIQLVERKLEEECW